MGKYCINCGKELHTGARFCAKCGAVVFDAPTSHVPVAQPKTAPPQMKTEAQPQSYASTVATSKRRVGRNALCIVLSVLLVAQTAAVALYGWPGFMVGSGTSGAVGLFGREKIVEKLSRETTRAGTETLALDMGDYPLDDEAVCEIKKVSAPAELEGVEIQAYEFNIDTDEELLSVMELTIPYDEKALGGLDPEGNIGAAYYNEETQEWEPVSFEVNDNGTVTIYTEHLSTYGCFVVKNENTRSAYVAYTIPSSAIFQSYNVDADSVVTEAAHNGGNPGPLALSTGLEILDVTLNIGSAGVDTISHILNTYSLNSSSLGITGNSLLDSISKKLGVVGTAVSIAQVASGMYNIYNGDADAIFPCYRDALKGSVAYVGGKVGSKLFSLAFLGVIAIDYSINKFGEEAWQGREDMYRKAYSLYYEEDNVRRSAKDWATLFLNARKTATSPDKYYLRVEGLIQRYADEFWKDETTVGIYQREASEMGFTGGGGLNEAMQTEISADFVKKLSRGVVQDAFKLIAERDARIAERDVLKELNSLKAELNKKCTLELYDGTLGEDKKQSDVAGGKACVVLPESITDSETWVVELSDQGEGKISFTLLDYLMAGMPGELNVYEKGAKEDEVPAAVIPFTMDDYTKRVDVGVDEGLPLEEILGTYDGTVFADGDSESHTFTIQGYGNEIILDDTMDRLNLRYDPSTGIASGSKSGPYGEYTLRYTYRFTFVRDNGTISMTGTSSAYLDDEYQATANFSCYKVS